MARTSKKAEQQQIVGSIHLYGTQRAGHGWIACRRQNGSMTGESYGNGEPKQDRSATTAIWQAAEALREAGCTVGQVEIHYDFDFGPRMAVADINHVPNFGALEWREGRVYVISTEAITAAAERCRHCNEAPCECLDAYEGIVTGTW